MSRRVAIIVAIIGVFSSPRALGASWPEVEAAVRPALIRALDGPAVERLLAREAVRRALSETLAGWDGRDDHLSVALDARGDLLIRVTLGTARTVCATTLYRDEGGGTPPVCSEQVDTVARDIALGRDLWHPAAPPRRPARPPTTPTSPPAVQEPEAPADTVVRRPILPAPDAEGSPEVLEAQRAWSAFRDSLPTRHWQDPFLPTDLTQSGTALMEPQGFSPLIEERSSANLRNPFSPERLGALLEIPAPEQHTLSRDVEEAPLIAALSDECLRDWQATERDAPPSLACFRDATQNARLDKGVFYSIQKALSQIGLAVSLPILDQLVALEMREAASHRAYHVVWAAVWLDFVNADPDARLASALAGLTQEEQRFLRRRLWRWWIARDLAPYRGLVTRIYERHFVALYPEARDGAGLPKRGFFNSTWLWASNWLSEVGDLPAAALTAAYEHLGVRERRVIDAFVADATVAERFPVACARLRR